MRCAVWLCAGLGAALPAQGFEHAAVSLSSPGAEYYVHERIPLRLRIGVRESFLRANVVQTFRRRLDLPVRVDADWWKERPATVDVPPVQGPIEPDGQRLTFVLDDRLAEGLRVTDAERPGWVFAEVEKTFLVERAGELVIPGPTLRLTYATRFREDFLEGRVAEDQREAVVGGESLALKIRPLPEAGRPPEFAGAVGRFTVSAEAAPNELEVGQSLKLVLRIEGEGNLALLDTPRLPLSGFHVYGRIEDVARGSRTVTYDLAPLHAGIREVPAIAFCFFDPGPPAEYRTVRTEPIALAVRGGGEVLPVPQPIEAAEPERTDIHDLLPAGRGPARGAGALSTPQVVLALLAPWLLALGLLSWRRLRARGPGDPEARVRGAAAAFRARVARPDADVASALAEYLATRTRSSVAAVIAPELPARLGAAGVPEDLAARAAALLDELVAARFGGERPRSSLETAFAVVRDIELALAQVEAGE